MHILFPMPTDTAWIPLVVREDSLHCLHSNLAVVFLNQGTHAGQPRTGIRQGMGLVSRELGHQIMVGMHAAVRLPVLEMGDAFWTDLHIGDLPLAITKHDIRCGASPVLC